MFCPNGSLNNQWVNNWKSECCLEFLVSCILTVFMIILGTMQILNYWIKSRPLPPSYMAVSKLFTIQMVITFLIPLFAVTWCLVEVLYFQMGVIYGYQVLYMFATVFVFSLLAKLFLMEKYKYLPNHNYSRRSLIMKFFCISVFVGKNVLFIAVLEENWFQIQNIKNKLKLSMFFMSYILSLLLLVLYFKSSVLISQSCSRYALFFNEDFCATERSNQIKKIITFFIWPKKNFALQLRVIACVLLVVASRVANVYIPIYTAKIVNNLTTVPPVVLQWNHIFFLISIILSQGFNTGFLDGCRSRLWIQVQQYTELETQVLLFHRLQKYSLEWHSSHSASEVIRNINRGTHSISILLSILLFNIGPYSMDIIVAVILFLLYFNWLITTVVFSSIALYLAFEIIMTKWTIKFQHQINVAHKNMEDNGIESIKQIETVKYCIGEKYEVQAFREAVMIYQKEKFKMKVFITVFKTFQNIFICCGLLTTFGVFFFFGFKEFTVSNYVLFAVYIIQILRSLNCFSTFYRKYKKYWSSIDFIIKLLCTKTDFADGDETINPKCSTIEFVDVNFDYGSKNFALKDISFSIRPGQLLAVVGPKGSGKTTIAKLLLKMCNVKNGFIKIGGKNIQNIAQETFRKCIGAVPQDVDLFPNNSIEFNLSYGTEKSSGTSVIDCIITSELRQKILNLPKKCDTQVGDKNLTLSAEEKRQIAISRVLLKNPPIMVFDEGASAPVLDEIKKRNELMLNEYFANCTVIYMTRTLSTIVENADKIIVIERGEIIESGSHQELMTKKGLYTKMWREHCASGLRKNKYCFQAKNASPITQVRHEPSTANTLLEYCQFYDSW